MSAVALRVVGLGKQYRLGGRTAGYRTLRESLRAAVGSFGPRRGARAAREIFWALKEVSLEVGEGEVMGVIGRNGAGKSTLLKILSRITEPTVGHAEVRGRLSSLLEVGTGFHGELTGAENIYLNGIILGMRRHEVRAKFDEIVEFAEVQRFLDTPVKHFSSGMYLRLAFAVAAHLEPEVLLVDEVLAVGDARFQRRCLDKIQDIGRSGRTVIFVSHDMAAITRICPRAVLLEGGHVIADGPAAQVVAAYLGAGLGIASQRVWEGSRPPGDDVAQLRRVRVLGDSGELMDAVDIRRPIHIHVEFDVLSDRHPVTPLIGLWNGDGVHLFNAFDLDTASRRPRAPGRYRSIAEIPGNLLAEGTMRVHVGLMTLDPRIEHAYERDAAAFVVVDTLEGDSARGDFGGRMKGVIRPLLRWESTRLDATR